MRTLATPLLLGLLAAGCSRPAPPPLQAQEARALLLNRNWLDTLPETEQDRLHVFRFVPSMGGGVYQDRTLYAGQFELFAFEHTGEEIRFNLPHRRERVISAYRITTLHPDEKSPFDLRLQLERSPRGPATYYSVRGEAHEDQAALDQELKGLLRAPR